MVKNAIHWQTNPQTQTHAWTNAKIWQWERCFEIFQVCPCLYLLCGLTSPLQICLHLLHLSTGGPSLSVIHLRLPLTCVRYKRDTDRSRLCSAGGRVVYPVGVFAYSTKMTSTAGRMAHQQQREQCIGTKQYAVKFSKQDYEALHQQCLKSGCLFEDNCFPAGQKSLGYNELGPYSPKTRGVVWKRPKVRRHLAIQANMTEYFSSFQLLCMYISYLFYIYLNHIWGKYRTLWGKKKDVKMQVKFGVSNKADYF